MKLIERPEQDSTRKGGGGDDLRLARGSGNLKGDLRPLAPAWHTMFRGFILVFIQGVGDGLSAFIQLLNDKEH